MKNKSGVHNRAEYQPGLIAEFKGVNSKTNRAVLKRLFDKISPTAFIDYTQNNTYGYIRFKDQNGASLAENYFSRESIIQVNENDLGVMYSILMKKLEMEYDNPHEKMREYDFIRLRILKG